MHKMCRKLNMFFHRLFNILYFHILIYQNKNFKNIKKEFTVVNFWPSTKDFSMNSNLPSAGKLSLYPFHNRVIVSRQKFFFWKIQFFDIYFLECNFVSSSKGIEFCHKHKFSNPLIFATWWKPYISNLLFVFESNKIYIQ